MSALATAAPARKPAAAPPARGVLAGAPSQAQEAPEFGMDRDESAAGWAARHSGERMPPPAIRARTEAGAGSSAGYAGGRGIEFTPSAGGILQRKCACGGNAPAGGECEECREKKLQRKLAIGSTSDPLEREADQVAERVLSGPPAGAAAHSPVRVQRFTGSVEAGAATAPASVDRVLASPGQPLRKDVREDMAGRFGHDFSGVRVHTDSAAAQSARDVNARAYTVGRGIVFGPGQFAPGEPAGRCLLAHELVHVVQQQSERAQLPTTNLPRTSRTRGALPGLTTAGLLLQRVQLTYDDGPDSAGHTKTVLDELNAAGARATFYVVGKRVAQGDNWQTVFAIAKGGHWLGNHAYDWNDSADEHIFLHGTAEERAEKILNTEWAIREALIKGRDDAKAKKTWDGIPSGSRGYINDVIVHGTGRFRTPGFKSKPWTSDGQTTLAALATANSVLAATGLRPLVTTELSKWGLDYEGVTVDPKDWKKGATQSDIESGVKDNLGSNDDSILLHSRLATSAAATPAIVADIIKRKFSFDPTKRGVAGTVKPAAGFAELPVISNPPTSSEITAARAWLKKNMLSFGPWISGSVSIGIFKLAQLAGQQEVLAFAAEIKATKVKTADGEIPMANWMNSNPEWRIFVGFFENWVTEKPFPHIKGVTI